METDCVLCEVRSVFLCVGGKEISAQARQFVIPCQRLKGSVHPVTCHGRTEGDYRYAQIIHALALKGAE
jgi:hypothetical protein